MKLSSLQSLSDSASFQTKTFSKKRKIPALPSLKNLSNPKKEEISEPIIDEAPSFINVLQSRTTMKSFSPSLFVRDLPNSIESKDFMEVFDNLITVCELLPDYTPGSENRMWEMKSSALRILNQFFYRNDSELLPQEGQNSIFNMLYKNIFDVVPKYPSLLESNFYQAAVIDPMSPHLNVCFRILMAFVKTFPNSKCLTESVLKKSISLLDQGDANVRNNLCNFIEVFLDLRIDLYHFILKNVSIQLNNVIENANSLYCVPELLKILFLLFIKANKHPHADFYTVIRNNVLVLLSSPYFYFFSGSFNRLIKTILERKKNATFVNKSKIRTITSNRLVSRPKKNILLQPQVRSKTEMVINPAKKAPIKLSSESIIKKTSMNVLKPEEVLTKLKCYWPKTNTLNIASFIDTTSLVLNSVKGDLDPADVRKMFKFMSHFLYIPSAKVHTAFFSLITSKITSFYPEEIIMSVYRILTKIEEKSKNRIQVTYSRQILDALCMMNPTVFQQASDLSTHSDAKDTEFCWKSIESAAEYVSDYKCNTRKFYKVLKKITDEDKAENYL